MSQAVPDREADIVIPKGALIAALALVLFALAGTAAVRMTGVGGTQMVLPQAVESRDLRFADGPNGSVLVYDMRDGGLLDTLAPGSNGFVRVVMRALARDRMAADIGAEPPFRLTRFVNGQMTLLDTSTGKQVDLAAFGSTNAAAFTRLMTLKGSSS